METKNILMIARHNKIEALRMATGLTLLDDMVHVLICGALEESAEAEEQLEALDFSDVPITRINSEQEVADAMAGAILKADMVYIL
jgi:hypothetical protein